MIVKVDIDVEVDDDVGNETQVSFLSFSIPPTKTSEKYQQRGAPQMPGTML